jgi:Rho GDP-dissociation inhibitor
MAPQEDELLPENATGYKLSQPKQSLADYQKMGKSNERYWISIT